MHCISTGTSSTERRLGSSRLRICLLTRSSNEISRTKRAGSGDPTIQGSKNVWDIEYIYMATPKCALWRQKGAKYLFKVFQCWSWSDCSSFFVFYLKLNILVCWLHNWLTILDTHQLFPNPTKARRIQNRARSTVCPRMSPLLVCRAHTDHVWQFDEVLWRYIIKNCFPRGVNRGQQIRRSVRIFHKWADIFTKSRIRC